MQDLFAPGHGFGVAIRKSSLSEPRNQGDFVKKSVALVIETSNEYARGILRGILKYQDEHDHWQIDLQEHERGAPPPRWLKKYQGRGIIARIETEEIARSIRASNLPAVDVSAARKLTGIPWVETDDTLISGLALNHFASRGLRNVAFCGEINFNWARWRRDAFVSQATEQGMTVDSFDLTAGMQDLNHPQTRARLLNWLKQLPEPCGLMAAYDSLARRLLQYCTIIQRPVPNSIAIVGVDNDPILCRMANPPLSSIIPDAEGAGYQAAALLESMMNQKKVEVDCILLPPLGIAVRRSSDTLSIDDEEIEVAARFILDEATKGINVSDVLNKTHLTRRALELRFRKHLGLTPHEFIVAARMSHAELLLRETSLTLQQIALRCGIESAEYLSTAFKKHAGMPPGQYRQLHYLKK